jgi:hypothetical protein
MAFLSGTCVRFAESVKGKPVLSVNSTVFPSIIRLIVVALTSDDDTEVVVGEGAGVGVVTVCGTFL